MIEAAHLRYDTGDIDRAERMLAAARDAADDHQRALIHFGAGELADEHDEVAALDHYRFAAEHARDYWAPVAALARLSCLLHDVFSDDPPAAEAVAAEAVQIAERSGDRLTLSTALRVVRPDGLPHHGRDPARDTSTWANRARRARRRRRRKASDWAVRSFANTLVDAYELDEARRLP